MCFNFAFVPVIYFTFIETNGYKLEAMDAIFAIAKEEGKNPVWVEKDVRKGKRSIARMVNSMDEAKSDKDNTTVVEDTQEDPELAAKKME